MFLSSTAFAQQPKRVALVIGNSNYTSVLQLANPANDADLIGKTLKQLRFNLVGNGVQRDLPLSAFKESLQKFSDQLLRLR